MVRELPSYLTSTIRKLGWICLLGCSLTNGTLATPASEPTGQLPETTTSSQAPVSGNESTDDQLPWKKTGQRTPQAPTVEDVSARQLLEIYGIDESQWSFLTDGNKWSPEAADTTVKILFHLPNIRRGYFERWSAETVPWNELVSEPETHRSQFFRLRGRVNKIEEKTVVKEAAELLQFDHYYQVHMEVTGMPHTAIVFTRQLPKRWQTEPPEDEKVEVTGLFLKAGPAEEPGRKFFFAAPRIIWVPDRPNPSQGITKHHVLLAKMGVDIGLFSHITRQTERAFSGEERECFFQLLKAVAAPQANSLAKQQPLGLTISEVLGNPADLQGQLFTLEGTARRITRIVVEDPEIQERYGIDHYYQLDLFVSLKGKSIQIKSHSTDHDAPVFSNRYPINICVRTLPPELKEMHQQLAAGQLDQKLLRANVRLHGFFFKLWTYQTLFASRENEEGFQLSPVFIATEPQMLTSDNRRNPYVGAVVMTVFLIALTAAWVFLWKNSRADRHFAKTTLKRQLEAEAVESLSKLDASQPDAAADLQADEQ